MKANKDTHVTERVVTKYCSVVPLQFGVESYKVISWSTDYPYTH